MPFVQLPFATLGGAFAEACALEPFAVLAVVCGAVVVGLVRGVHTGVVVGFETGEAAINNPVDTDGANCGTVFPSGHSPVVSKS